MTRTDTLVVVMAALLVAGLYAKLWQPAAAGTTVAVWVMGEERLQLALSEDRTEQVRGAIGFSVIEVRDGRARVVDSPGAQQICQRMGWLERAGDSAICLPNQVVVEIRGGAPRFDSLHF